jgi:hypothetical protein
MTTTLVAPEVTPIDELAPSRRATPKIKAALSSSQTDGPAEAIDAARPKGTAPTASPSQTNGSAATKGDSTTKAGTSLADPFLALAADVVDDTERTKIANQNRLRQLTRVGEDSDGLERGFGLDETHPDVRRLASLVAMLEQVEHDATLNLARKMREHPLGPWVKQQKGVGDKQAARLLAVIGDPYINSATGQPRTVSQLWAYSGLHVLPVGQVANGAQNTVAGGDPKRPVGQDVIAHQDGHAGGSNPGVSQSSADTQSVHAGSGASTSGGDLGQGSLDAQSLSAGVAARRQRGQQVNWSTLAKTRAYLVAESMLRAGNREVYDRRKAATEGRLHVAPCVRCGPSGKPAQVGTPWSAAHRHADALRIVSKDLLKGLWREARRLHGVVDEEA